VWTAGGLLWLAANLAALAVGLFPRAVHPAGAPTVPPALQALAVGQVAFALIAYPLMIHARGRRPRWRDAAEWVVWALLAAPFVGAAAWLADADAPDVARAATIVVVAFAAGSLLGRVALVGRAAASVALLAGLVAVAGGPAAVHLAWTYLAPGPGPPETLWRLCPTTFAWSAAASGGGAWLPSPLWPPAIWVAVAGLLWTLGRPVGKAKGRRAAG